MTRSQSLAAVKTCAMAAHEGHTAPPLHANAAPHRLLDVRDLALQVAQLVCGGRGSVVLVARGRCLREQMITLSSYLTINDFLKDNKFFKVRFLANFFLLSFRKSWSKVS